MNPHDESPNYRPDAKPNRVTDNRPLDCRDDTEQVAYLTQYKIDHPNGDNFWLIVATIVVVLALCLYVNHRHNKPTPLTLYTEGSCFTATCHVEPVIKTLNGYKQDLVRRAKLKRLAEKGLMADLKEFAP